MDIFLDFWRVILYILVFFPLGQGTELENVLEVAKFIIFMYARYSLNFGG